jgi:hypothetical protein
MPLGDPDSVGGFDARPQHTNRVDVFVFGALGRPCSSRV